MMNYYNIIIITAHTKVVIILLACFITKIIKRILYFYYSKFIIVPCDNNKFKDELGIIMTNHTHNNAFDQNRLIIIIQL